jgi:hypothetical protein
MVKPPELPTKACITPLPLRITSPPEIYLHAAAARTQMNNLQSDIQITGPTPNSKLSLDHEMMRKHDDDFFVTTSISQLVRGGIPVALI